MRRPYLGFSIALVVALLHPTLADLLEARNGKQFDKNTIREPLGPKVDTYWPVFIKWDVCFLDAQLSVLANN